MPEHSPAALCGLFEELCTIRDHVQGDNRTRDETFQAINWAADAVREHLGRDPVSGDTARLIGSMMGALFGQDELTAPLDEESEVA